MNTTIELRGLELYGRHGVLEEERTLGQRFVVDVELVYAGEPEAAVSDRIEDAADYREVVALVQEISDGHAYQLLEALATALADGLMARFPLERTKVRVRKPEVRLALPVEYAAAVVERVSERRQ